MAVFDSEAGRSSECSRIDCLDGALNWKELALELIQNHRAFKLQHVRLREAAPLETAADRCYSIHIVGYDSGTDMAQWMHFVPWSEASLSGGLTTIRPARKT